MTSPVLETEQLQLRLLRDEDLQHLVKYAGSSAISAKTSRIPHPYTSEAGQAFIALSAGWTTELSNRELILGIISKAESHLIGCIGLIVESENDLGELGFWVGEPFWGRGVCTEAARCVLDYAFTEMSLNCVTAVHFPHNVGSAKVIKKLGMKYEGRLRQRVKKDNVYVDSETYSILRSEYKLSC